MSNSKKMCMCGHPLVDHERERDTGFKHTGKCRHREYTKTGALRRCNCRGFEESDFFVKWSRVIEKL